MTTLTLQDLTGLLRDASGMKPVEEERLRLRQERARLDMECSFHGAFLMLVVANLARRVEGFPDVVGMGLGTRGDPAPSLARGPDGVWRWNGSFGSFQSVSPEAATLQTAYGAVLGALGARHTYETAAVLARVSGWDAPSAADKLADVAGSLPRHVLSALLGHGLRMCERLGVHATVASLRPLADDWAKAVLALGVDIDAAPGPGQDPPAVAAAKAGDGWTLESLLGLGAAVDARDPEGLTPFLAGVRLGKRHVVRAALEKGAAEDAVTTNGRNALHCVAEAALSENVEGAYEVFEMIRDLGLDGAAETNYGYSPLMLLAEIDHGMSPEERRKVQVITDWVEKEARSRPPAP